MARRTKDTPGRSTPKGGAERSGRSTATTSSGRYTAPIPRAYRSSPWWVPAIMLTFFALGLVTILLNYMGVLPGGASNFYLVGGLGCIIAGFITATKYR